MNIYTYISSCNPYQAKAILHKYGYSTTNVKDSKDLGDCLKKLVGKEGECALNDIIDSHPDKGIIIEKYCSEKSLNKNIEFVGNENRFMNLDGTTSTTPTSTIYPVSQSVKETNVFILAAALLLAAAIIVKK